MLISLASLVLASQDAALRAEPLVYPPLLWPSGRHEGHRTIRALGSGGAGSSAFGFDAPAFAPVDALDHQDDFWQSSLVGDADHDGLQEIVLRHVPVPSGSAPNRIVFYEDDGQGQFGEVASFPLADGGILAMGDVDQDGLTDLFCERARGICDHEFFRMESSSPTGFPDHEVWSSTKQGNVVDFRGWIADSDGDGRREFLTGDSDFGCFGTTLKIFEASSGDQMDLILNLPLGSNLGNPVVADLDRDGRQEIAVADVDSLLFVLEASGDDAYLLTGAIPTRMFNAYQLAVISRGTPGERPLLFLAGQAESLDYRVEVFASPENDRLRRVNGTAVPSNCGASIPQIVAADVTGSSVPEILLDRLCDPVPIFGVGERGALTLLDVPSVPESLEIVATSQTAAHSGAIAVGTYPTGSNPLGQTIVLESP